MGSPCEQCGETRPPCLCNRVQMSDEEHTEATLDRLMALNARPATSKRALLPRVLQPPALTVGDLIGLRKDADAEWSALTAIGIARRMRCLAANLATAGALCHTWFDAYATGWHDGRNDPEMECLKPRGSWFPGCGRPMPGWGGGE